MDFLKSSQSRNWVHNDPCLQGIGGPSKFKRTRNFGGCDCSVYAAGGVWDRAWIDAGHEVVAGCELVPHRREIYRAWCGSKVLTADLRDLPDLVRGQRFDGIIGGIPCQSRSRLKGVRVPKFGDLLGSVHPVLEACKWDWCLLENVSALAVPGWTAHRMDAMHYAVPHQSRPRFFTTSAAWSTPPRLYEGTSESLVAYPAVVGRLYGARRAAIIQGWGAFADLPFPSQQIQEACADGVPRGLSEAWIRQICGSASGQDGRARDVQHPASGALASPDGPSCPRLSA